MIEHPLPFNLHPPIYKRGDKVVDRFGTSGIILKAEDSEEYLYGRPSEKWELVAWDGKEPPYNRSWIGNIWIRLL